MSSGGMRNEEMPALSPLTRHCSTQPHAQVRTHFMDPLVAVDPNKISPLRVVTDHRERIAQIDGDAILYDVALVVRTLKQGFATCIADAVDVRPSKTLVVGRLADWAHPATGQPIDEYRLGHIQIERRPHAG